MQEEVNTRVDYFPANVPLQFHAQLSAILVG